MTVPREAVSGRSVSATVGVIAGLPVTGCCAGAAVALPVNATVCVPAAFVATRVADFAPAGATGVNLTCTVQLPPRGAVPVDGPTKPKFAGVAGVNENVAVNELRPPFVTVNVRAALNVPTCWSPNAPPVSAV